MEIYKELEEIKKKILRKKEEKNELKTLKEIVEDLEKKQKNLTSLIENLPIKVSNLEEEIIKLKNIDISRLERKYEKFEELYEKLNEHYDKVKDIILQIRDIKDINNTKKVLFQSLNEVDKLKDDLANKIKDIEKMEEEIKLINKKLTNINNLDLENRLNNLENIVNTQIKKTEEVIEKFKTLEELESCFKKLEIGNLEKNIEKLIKIETFTKNLEKEFEEIKHEFRALKESLIDQKELKNLAMLIEDIKNKHKETKEIIENINRMTYPEFKNMINKTILAEKEIEKIKEQLIKLENNLDETKKYVNEFTNKKDLSKYENFYEELRSKLDNTKKEIDENVRKIKEIQEEISTINLKLKDMSDDTIKTEINNIKIIQKRSLELIEKILNDLDEYLEEVEKNKKELENIKVVVSQIENKSLHYTIDINEKSKIEKYEPQHDIEVIEKTNINEEIKIIKTELENLRNSISILSDEIHLVKMDWSKLEMYIISIIKVLHEIEIKIKEHLDRIKIERGEYINIFE
ncbi:MAG: hypothetical protein QW038_02850 [Nanopusillaceae archaeon]